MIIPALHGTTGDKTKQHSYGCWLIALRMVTGGLYEVVALANTKEPNRLVLARSRPFKTASQPQKQRKCEESLSLNR